MFGQIPSRINRDESGRGFLCLRQQTRAFEDVIVQ